MAKHVEHTLVVGKDQVLSQHRIKTKDYNSQCIFKVALQGLVPKASHIAYKRLSPSCNKRFYYQKMRKKCTLISQMPCSCVFINHMLRIKCLLILTNFLQISTSLPTRPMSGSHNCNRRTDGRTFMQPNTNPSLL